MRPAANSMPSGSQSTAAQIATSSSRSVAVTSPASPARSMNNATPTLRSNGPSGYTDSPGTPNGCCEVTSTLNPAAAVTNSATECSTCSALSRTSTVRLVPSAAMIPGSGPFGSIDPSDARPLASNAAATAGNTSAARPSGASSTSTTGLPDCPIDRASSAARRDFPLPATPTTVVIPGSARRVVSVANSRPRPTKLVIGAATGAGHGRGSGSVADSLAATTGPAPAWLVSDDLTGTADARNAGSWSRMRSSSAPVSGEGSTPNSSDNARRSRASRSNASAWRPVRYNANANRHDSGSCSGCRATSPVSSVTTSPAAPSSRFASSPATVSESRQSSSRSPSAAANGIVRRSASACPRHSASAALAAAATAA
ncbi:hypothetical protein OG203_30030 [Nocardia sp. NBC_01499]